MIVYGKNVDGNSIDAAINALRDGGGLFTADDLANQLDRAGVDGMVSYRAADRILQEMRKRGEISFSNGKWAFAKESAA